MKRSRLARVGLAMTAIGVLAGAAWGQLTTIERCSVTMVTMDDATFAGARASFQNRFDVRFGAPMVPHTFSWMLKGGFENFAFGASEGLSFSTPPPLPTGTGEAVATFTAKALSAGTLTGELFIDYDTPAVAGENPENSSFLGVFTWEIDGVERWAMRFRGGGTGGLLTTGVSVASLVLPGEWGQDAGDAPYVGLLEYNTFYTVTQNFVYDPVSDTTTFGLRGEGSSVAVGPRFDIVLVGAPVPAPAGAMIVAGGGLIGVRRRRKG